MANFEISILTDGTIELRCERFGDWYRLNTSDALQLADLLLKAAEEAESSKLNSRMNLNRDLWEAVS